MSPGLRSMTPKGGLLHLYVHVLRHDNYKLVFDSLGVMTTDDFLLIDPDDLREVQFDDGKGGQVSLNVMQIGSIKKVQAWFYAQVHQDVTTWYELELENFTDFVRKYKKQNQQRNVPSKINSTKVGEALPGVKKDISAYPKFRDDKMWLSWNRALKAIAATQGMAEVSDIGYIPPDDDKEVFYNKSKFMFGVFTATLVSKKAKSALQVYETDHDGQMVYAALVQMYSDGTTACWSRRQLAMPVKWT